MDDNLLDFENLIDLCDEPADNWPWIVLLFFWWLV